MALLKSKVGNSVYSWKSDDVRDAELAALENKFNTTGLKVVHAFHGSFDTSSGSGINLSLTSAQHDNSLFMLFIYSSEARFIATKMRML